MILTSSAEEKINAWLLTLVKVSPIIYWTRRVSLSLSFSLHLDVNEECSLCLHFSASLQGFQSFSLQTNGCGTFPSRRMKGESPPGCSLTSPRDSGHALAVSLWPVNRTGTFWSIFPWRHPLIQHIQVCRKVIIKRQT